MHNATPEMTLLRDAMAPARDGVNLASDIYLPLGDGPFPVILERAPYDKTAPTARVRRTWCSRSFPVGPNRGKTTRSDAEAETR
ncbi:MAG TPA: CocE/NonD family hydrolase [Stellaceae bacterium]|jgi:predicted acyl esterase|nr:CocE/NonD family hydrolase [Stellaceae bacterium]